MNQAELKSFLEEKVIQYNTLDFIEQLATVDKLPDIIISEVQLNDLNDISIFRYIRLHYPDIKLLAYSGDDSEWTVDQVLKEGADAFLEKGCSLHALQQELHRIACGDFQPR